MTSIFKLVKSRSQEEHLGLRQSERLAFNSLWFVFPLLPIEGWSTLGGSWACWLTPKLSRLTGDGCDRSLIIRYFQNQVEWMIEWFRFGELANFNRNFKILILIFFLSHLLIIVLECGHLKFSVSKLKHQFTSGFLQQTLFLSACCPLTCSWSPKCICCCSSNRLKSFYGW